MNEENRCVKCRRENDNKILLCDYCNNLQNYRMVRLRRV